MLSAAELMEREREREREEQVWGNRSAASQEKVSHYDEGRSGQDCPQGGRSKAVFELPRPLKGLEYLGDGAEGHVASNHRFDSRGGHT